MKTFKQFYSLLEAERWITIKGRHILIGKDGEILSPAPKEFGQKIDKVYSARTLAPEKTVGKLISNSNIMKNSVTLNKSSFSKFEDFIKKMNKKAATHNLPPITYKVVNEYKKKYLKTDPTEFDKFYDAVDVEISGSQPEVKGYKLVATVERMGNENIIRSINDEHDLSKYRNKPLFCEHCGTARVKKNSIILQTPTGELMEVGKSCVSDFLGSTSLDEYIKNMTSLNSYMAGQEDEEMERGSSGVDSQMSVEDILAVALNIIRKQGYVSAQKSEETGKTSTRTLVSIGLHGKADQRIDPDSGDYEEAKKMIEWAKNQKDGSDYMQNLGTIARHGFGNYRHYGYIASIPVAYAKAMGAINNGSNGSSGSNYVGQIGSKIETKVKILSNTAHETDYGISHLVRMVDDDGNQINTFCSGNFANAVPGEEVVIKGTVKNHSEYKGVKQTQLTRCAFK